MHREKNAKVFIEFILINELINKNGLIGVLFELLGRGFACYYTRVNSSFNELELFLFKQLQLATTETNKISVIMWLHSINCHSILHFLFILLYFFLLSPSLSIPLRNSIPSIPLN